MQQIVETRRPPSGDLHVEATVPLRPANGNNRSLRIAGGTASVIERSVPHPVAGFVLVHQAISPICIEQRAYVNGFAEGHEGPDHFGHEGVGEVVAVGSDASRFSVGDRVVAFQGWSCGSCWVCARGLGSTHCLNWRGPADIEHANACISGGAGFSEFRLVPELMLERIPDDLSFRYAAAATCLLGCSFSAANEAGVAEGDVCLVSGVGPVGHGAIVNLKRLGCTVVALSRNPYRMDIAKRLGADLLISPSCEYWLETVRELTGDRHGVDFAFECSGHALYQRRALQSLRPYGMMVQLGQASPGGRELTWPINTEFDLLWGHKRIMGHMDVHFSHREHIVSMLGEPQTQRAVDTIVTHEFPMSQASVAFEEILKGKTSKVYLNPRE